jgi:hypothetical protein
MMSAIKRGGLSLLEPPGLRLNLDISILARKRERSHSTQRKLLSVQGHELDFE